MTTLVVMGISNAVQVTALAAVVFLVARLVRNAAISRCLWLLVLLKLVTPPVLSIPLFCLPQSWNASDDVRSPTVADLSGTRSAVPRSNRQPAVVLPPAPTRATNSPGLSPRTVFRSNLYSPISLARSNAASTFSGVSGSS